MKSRQQTGFTLLELMVVIVIIGIFSALAIPGIMEIRYRNILSDSVERVRSAGGATRDLAMQTRKAAVLEVTSTGVWINLLAGAGCDSNIELRCTTGLGNATDGFISLYDAAGIGVPAGVAICGGFVLSPSSDPGSENTCTENIALVRDNGFALCYSGAGELFYRIGADENTICSAAADPSDDSVWTRACSTASEGAMSVAFSDASTYSLTDGAVLMFNRYNAPLCQNAPDALDIRRLVIFPTNGSPFSQIGGAEGAQNADTDTN